MHGPAEDQVRRKWIQLYVRFPRTCGKPQLVEYAVPLRWRPVIVRQGNIVTRVSHPVHEPQRRVRKRSLEHVIFDNNDLSSHANRLRKQDRRVVRVMEYIKKHHNIEAAIAVWYRCAIEWLDVDRRICAHADVNPLDGNVWSLVSNESSKPAVTGTNVKHAGIPRH